MVHLPYNCRNLFCLYLDNCTFSTFYITESLHRIKYKAPVVRRLDNAIYWKNRLNLVVDTAKRFTITYPLDSVIRPSYDWALDVILIVLADVSFLWR